MRSELTQPNWNSTFMSTVAGAAAQFDRRYSPSAFFVESGYFAALNIQHEVKPCGPYCWDHSLIVSNLAAMGISLTWLRSSFDYQSAEYREHMLEQIFAVDSATIVGIAGMEFQLLLHRDEQRLVFTLPWGPKVKTCIRELTCVDLLSGRHCPSLAWFTLKPTSVTPLNTRLNDSLTRSLAFYSTSIPATRDGYSFGPTAWEQWATALESGSYDVHGHWWNSMVWSEARQQAAKYFEQNWIGPTDMGIELSTTFKAVSSSIEKSVGKELTNSERADFIRRAQDFETGIEQHLVGCIDAINSDKGE